MFPGVFLSPVIVKGTGDGSLSLFFISARWSAGWSRPMAGLPLCAFPVIPSALLRSPAGGVRPGRLCIRLMPESASERELAHSAGMTGNAQSSACHREAPTRSPPALSRPEGKRQRAVFGTARRVVRRGVLALAGCLFTRPGLPGHQNLKISTLVSYSCTTFFALSVNDNLCGTAQAWFAVCYDKWERKRVPGIRRRSGTV